MRQIEIGDYVINNEEIWEIVEIRKEGVTTVYDLKKLTGPADFLEVFDDESSSWQQASTSKNIKGVTVSYLRHMGQIIPKNSDKAIKILFGD